MANLIVEDKTGLENSNTYISVQYFKDFAELNGIDLTEITDDKLAVYCVQATNFIDSLEYRFVGKRLSLEQSLAFPRKRDCNGSHLYDMRNLLKACCYAVQALCTGLNLLPIQVSKDDIVTKEKIEGAIEVQYSADHFEDVILGKFPMIERLLSDYLVNLDGQVSVMR